MRNPLLGALPLLAQALGDKYGITVDIGGQGAWTDGDTIHLPALPLDDDGQLWVLANGYLDHEAGHVRHTDFTVAKGKTPLHQALSNLLEDIRVDARMGERYPGCLSNSQRLDAQLVAAGDYRIPAVDAHPAQVLQSYLLQRGRSLLLGAEALTPLADRTEAVFRQVFPPGLATRLSAALYGARDLASTQAAVDLAAQLVALVQDAADSTPPGQTPGSAPASPPPTAAGQTSASPGQAPADSGQNPTEPDQTPAGAGPTASQQVLRQALNASEADLLPDRNRLVADRLAATATQPPQQNGRVAVARSGGHGKGTARFGPPPDLAAVRRASVALRARLAGLVQAARLYRSLPHRTGQRLETRQLHRLALRDPRLFLRHWEQPAVNTAVLVLLDRSGSMAGTDLQIAREAVLATALALEAIPGIQVATAAFPQDAKDVLLLTGFGQRVQTTLPHYGIAASGGTPLAEALWWAAWQLVRRPEPRKLLLVATDGQPNDRPAAQAVSVRLTAAGIELLGIGIRTILDPALFPSGMTIGRLEDLAPALFALLQARLRAG